MAPFRYSVFQKTLRMRDSLIFLAALGFSLASTIPARAITAEDVTKRMGQEQRFAYLSGLIDMLAYQTAAAGNRDKGNCIIDAFYRDKSADSHSRLMEVLEKFSDKRPEILLTVLVNQICKN